MSTQNESNEIRTDAALRALEDLNNLVGIQPVKDFVTGMVNLIRHDQRLAEQGIAPADRPMMHMLFMGNPGTGKTTVAKLMGRIFKGLGVLSKGHVVETKGGDLVGSHVGEGLDKTKEKIREALGGVLFIDEIYGLTEGSLGDTYGQDVINNALVPALTDYKNSLIVIGAGYTDPVKKFLVKNEGLKRRFPNQIVFPNFSGEELIAILTNCASRNGYKISEAAGEKLRAALHVLALRPPAGFGNARDMESYFTEMKKNLAYRLKNVVDASLQELNTFQESDIPDYLKELAGAEYEPKETTASENIITGRDKLRENPAIDRLNRLIGLQNVKKKIEEMAAYAEEFGGDDPGTLHMAFLGNPGTGKTTVAGLVGEIFRDTGLLKRGHTVVAENREALVAEYEGQTAPKTNELINQALDGVLFIDEAHNLIREEGNDPFGQEAVRTLVARMERERNRLCVIMAGYPAPIRRLIASDPGLRRRIGNEVLFEDYTPQELLSIFALIAQKGRETGKPPVTPETLDAVGKVLNGMYETQNPEYWGNARAVRNLYEDMLRECAKRTRRPRDTAEQDLQLLAEDVPLAYRS